MLKKLWALICIAVPILVFLYASAEITSWTIVIVAFLSGVISLVLILMFIWGLSILIK